MNEKTVKKTRKRKRDAKGSKATLLIYPVPDLYLTYIVHSFFCKPLSKDFFFLPYFVTLISLT